MQDEEEVLEERVKGRGVGGRLQEGGRGVGDKCKRVLGADK